MDRRVARTRTALIEAFNHLVLQRRMRRIKVADIVEQANVGRSTFYEHYSNADAVMLEAIRRPLGPIADAAVGQGDLASVTHIVEHFWQNRERARDGMAGRLQAQITRVLTEMVAERLEARGAPLTIPIPLAARQLAEVSLAPIRGWVTAEAPCSAEALAQAICRCGTAMIAALSVHDHKLP
jgi:AcrR family transcriptional regulator